ncbi:MAG: 50S ribosomal protein L32 [Candidatus Komeilibacteria bacterium]|jgi:large subunit ribosomal protein L32|nr:50S ribosomal protein L32 [Candidatus Komeilibacteria bacterium]MBT4447194.1 50S ribosomal protein L32 [Candidatus Komeilibacteria bacterium]
MSVPKKKRTKGSVKRRGSHFALKEKAGIKCSNCAASIMPHRACAKCGYYKGEKKVK